MQATFYYNFSKKKNSTKRPDSTVSSVTKTIALKENTSVESPIFIIEGGKFDADYVLWSNHYYFVTDTILVKNNITEVHCVQDVLATYRSYIGNSTFYIERFGNENDVNVNLFTDEVLSPDNRWFKLNKYLISFPNYSADGCYIVQTIGDSIYNNFALSKADFVAFKQWLGARSDFQQVYPYLLEVKWYPFTVDSLSEHASSGNPISSMIKLGTTSFARSINVAKTNVIYYSLNYPVTWSLGIMAPYGQNWRSKDPRFTTLQLYALGNTLDIDTTWLDVSASLGYDYSIDPLAGTLHFRVIGKQLATNDDVVVTTFTKQVGLDIRLSNTSANTSGLISSGIQAVGGLGQIASDRIASGLSSFADGISSAFRAAYNPTPHSVGNVGDRAESAFYDKFGYYVYARQTIGTITPYGGGTYNTTSKISDLGTGYFIKCSCASIDIPGRAADREEINNYLNNGFFYE